MTINPEVTHYSVPVRSAHPISLRMAGALAWLHGRGINGHAGAVRYGYLTPRAKFGGYVQPQQMFVGWNPRRVASGSIRPTPGGLPGTQAPAGSAPSPLLALIAQTGKR